MALVRVFETVRADLSAEGWKDVACVHCGEVYVYRIGRVVAGYAVKPVFADSTQASLKAEERAADQAPAVLAHACDPVACPRCGWYQAEMVRILKRPKGLVLQIMGVVAALLGILVAYAASVFDPTQPAFPKSIVSPPWLLGPTFGVLLCVFGWIRRAKFDPNSDADARAGRPVSPWDGPFTLQQFKERLGQSPAQDH